MNQRFSQAVFSGAFTFLSAILMMGCDDGETKGQGGAGATGGGGSGATGGGGAGGSGGSGGSTTTGGNGGGTSTNEFAALVQGTLFTTDLAMAKTKHDEIASGGESSAKAAGDIAHKVLLGTTLLGTTENGFLAMDRWTDANAMKGFYENPDIQAAFGQLFSGPPMLETFQHQPTWHSWGDITSGDTSDPYYWVVVRGHLKEADAAKAQAAHDAVAGGGEAQAKGAGDVAHVVFTGIADSREFLAVDIWHDTTNLEALYTNPDFVMAFGMLFDAQPKVVVHASTDWHQW